MKSRLIQETVGYEGACEMLDCGKNTILNLCKAGELASTPDDGVSTLTASRLMPSVSAQRRMPRA